MSINFEGGMFLRPRKIRLIVKLAGFKMPIAEAKIVKYADMLEAKTELVCPKCLGKPKLY